MKMRFHLLALPNIQTTKAYSLDGFCMATIRMAKLLKELGHEVLLYASEENEAPCDELITVISKKEQTQILGACEYQYAALNNNAYPLWELANNRIISAIGKRKMPRDFILTIGGTSQSKIASAHPDLMTVEYSIGYVSSFSKYRVYESHYWRAWSSGTQGKIDGEFFDEVIPLFFDESEFKYREEKEPFALYVGRLIPKKGLVIACEAAEKAGMKLKVIGHGDPSLITHGGEYLGPVTAEERNDWMSRASVLICPTIYIEPFGSIAVEAQMCGTPVVSTAFGGFIETVEHGRTGFHCNYIGQFVRGLQDCEHLDRKYIRDRAVEKYSYHNVKHQYQRYFDRLMLLWDQGFQSLE
jgi:glycosyltransferase involved in cell wall biosynthesis